jgi:hypothetical protein
MLPQLLIFGIGSKATPMRLFRQLFKRALNLSLGQSTMKPLQKSYKQKSEMLRQAQHDLFEYVLNRHPEALEGSRDYAKVWLTMLGGGFS